MPTNYPTTLDDETTMSTAALTENVSAGHLTYHPNENGAIQAVEKKLGIGSSLASAAAAGQFIGKNADGTTSWQAPPSAAGQGQVTATRVVASSDATAVEKATANYVCDATNDEVEINQAINDIAPAYPIAVGGLAGRVLLVGRNFTIGNGQTTNAGSVVLKSGVWLQGQGPESTWIKAAGSFANTTTPPGMIELFGNSGTLDTQFTKVSDLTLNGNTANGGRVMGFKYVGTSNNVYQFSDSVNVINDVYVRMTWGHGVYLEFGRAARLSGIRVIDAGGSTGAGANTNGAAQANGCDGFYLSVVDSFISGCESGSASGHGFHIANTNNRIVNCKSWFSDLSGYKVDAVRTTMVACEAQDNNNHGFEVTSGYSIVADCYADSNGFHGGATTPYTGSGFYIAASRLFISGVAIDKNEGSRGIYQEYGVKFSGLQNGVQCFVTTNGNAVDSTGGTVQTGAGNCLIISDNDPAKTAYFKFTGGRFYCNAPATATTDAELGAGDVSFYLDEAGNNLKVRVRYSNGTTLKTATIALV